MHELQIMFELHMEYNVIFLAVGDSSVSTEVTGRDEEGETHPPTTKEDEGIVNNLKVN